MFNKRTLLTGAAALTVAAPASAIAESAIRLDPAPDLGPFKGSQDNGRMAPLDPAARASRIAWLSANTGPLRSIDFADNDFADLEPMRAAIGDARMVLLGEQSHGDGTTFVTKSRMVRFLHERLGFDVLAFESGLYSMRKVWERIRAGEPARSAVRRGIHGIWSASREIQPLFDYIGEHAQSSRPLELAGFDCQFVESPTQDRFADDLAAFLAAHRIETASVPAWPRFRDIIENVSSGKKWRPSAEENQFVLATIDHLSARLAAAQGSEVEIWRQIFKSTKALSDFLFRLDPSTTGLADIIRRDAAMGDNLVWLAREVYPQRKIIVWAASFHNIRNMSLMDPSLKDVRVMGDFVWEAFGEQTYNIGFTACEGARGKAGDSETAVDAPLAGSLEELWGATQQSNAFLDLRNVPKGGEWLEQPIVSYLLNGQATTLYWRKLFDAAVFQRIMRRSTMAE